LAPNVITTPYSSTICHSAVTKALAQSPIPSSTLPISSSRRGPSRSTSTPTSGALMPPISCETE
jgi:hypothetical protein